MEYTVRDLGNYRLEYHITKGTAYIAFVTMGGCGFRIDEVKEGESRREKARKSLAGLKKEKAKEV